MGLISGRRSVILPMNGMSHDRIPERLPLADRLDGPQAGMGMAVEFCTHCDMETKWGDPPVCLESRRPMSPECGEALNEMFRIKMENGTARGKAIRDALGIDRPSDS